MIRSGESNLVGAGCDERLWRSQQSEANSERGKEIAFARGAKVFEVILLNYLFMISSPMSEKIYAPPISSIPSYIYYIWDGCVKGWSSWI